LLLARQKVTLSFGSGSKKKYRNPIPEPGTTISGFADNKKTKNEKINPDRPTLDFFDM
jgi:hypothetical protein